MSDFLPYAYLKGQFVPFEEAKISVATHALHYGTAALGGLRGLPNPANSKEILLFRLEDHCRRLSRSAHYLGYELPTSDIKARIIEWVQKNQPSVPFYIRPLVYTSGLGIAPRLHDIEKDFLIYGMPLGDYLSATGVTCRISSWQRQCDRSFPLRGKLTTSYIVSALAKTEAVSSGFDEAILLNAQGKVCEASGMNLFLVRDGQLITPSVDQDILEGITRRSVIELAQAAGVKVMERPVDRTELLIADEVFLTGTAARIVPVSRIETYTLPSDRPLTLQLQKQLQAIVEGREPQYRHWIDVIPL
ncbi:branched-chain amino acid aminotransferase IlvE [Thermosynechococcus sp. NK55a]|jgi:branched-chain amino acid aminotransferase|uniref:branched-chain amino acid transaminase n=2 Tax=Thermosynechococcus TaxID=146785 RepID=UPI0003D8B3CB|nr:MULTISPECIES: branched-chain amino acid transaminase [unclassified Thermosynechococcus]AHB87907.1 branched-chain amino acid aminotransferase IlvE [Thermosynechococcus sp. NK55a]HIK23622.1 branched-chain amino acid transaminase [Thermosynechococcus sp. M3746_W2019_013]